MKKIGHEEIGGCWFTVYQVDQREDLQNLLADAMRHGGRKLSDVYAKPSDVKKRIYADWEQWANKVPRVCYLGISSRNVWVFSLSFVYTESGYSTRSYGVAVGRITKGANKLFVW